MKVRVKLNNPFRKKRFSGSLSEKLAGEKKLLLTRREERTKEVKSQGLKWLAGGAAFGALSALLANPSFRKGIVGIATIGAITGSYGAWAEHYGRQRSHIQKITNYVGKGLHEESQKNQALKDFLAEHRYVIVDKKGNIAGTNMPRILGMGYLRLETNKILAGKY